MSDDEEMVLVNAEVPKPVRDAAKEKLEYGGMSREIRELLTRVAFGEDLAQRSRLEQQLDALREQREELQRERREIDSKIENVDSRISGIETKLSSLSSREERYESKLEELEYRLRGEGTRLGPDSPVVKRVAKESETEPEGVIKDLKKRNPDVPDYAFEEKTPYADEPSWHGVAEENVDLAVEDREARYR